MHEHRLVAPQAYHSELASEGEQHLEEEVMIGFAFRPLLGAFEPPRGVAGLGRG